MLRRLMVLALICLAGVLPFGGAAAQEAPPGPELVQWSLFESPWKPAPPLEEVQLVVDFAPGAGVARHVHGGPAFITVLAGAITLRMGGEETAYRAGDAFLEHPGEFSSAQNTGPEKVRLFVTYLVPKGAPLTTLAEGGSSDALPAGPTTVYQFRRDLPDPPADYDVVHVLLRYPPGAAAAPRAYAIPGLVTLIEGGLAVRDAASATSRVAGDTWLVPAGAVQAVANEGDVPALSGTTYLLPRGARLADVLPAGN